MAVFFNRLGQMQDRTFDISGITAAHDAVVKQTPFSLYNYHRI
jgi:hypothetical protein